MSDAEEAHISIPTYLVIFVVLLMLTGITVAVAFVDLGALKTPVALGIAVIKATLILAFFMHLKGQNKLLLCFALAGFFWVGLLTLGTMDDYLTRESPTHPELKHK
jgi:cytochrome c oxidase subunit IV